MTVTLFYLKFITQISNQSSCVENGSNTKPSSELVKFDNPRYAEVDKAGCRSSPSVVNFDYKSEFITKFQFEDPEHLAIDFDGNVYVSDRGNNNIQKFSPKVEP